MRSVPGWVFPGDGFVYRADDAASVVIPGSEYTTRIRTLADDGVNIGDDLPAFWGATVGGRVLGSGNPGDTLSHWGVVVEVTDQAEDGTYGVINFKNRLFETATATDYGASGSGDSQYAYIGQQATADVMVKNLSGALINALIVVEVPDNVMYVPGSMGAGLVGVSKDDAASLNQAAEYIESIGFDDLLALPEPADVGFIAYAADAVLTDSVTSFTYDYVGYIVGTETPEYIVRHANGGTFGTVQPLTPMTVKAVRVFFPVTASND